MGGEWTTRRRTISDSEIALFSAVSGDFSPLAVDAPAAGGARQAPPALVVAVAVGLASMDMPIPHVSTWEWASWKFPRPVRAGDTVYARWTLTQKRAPERGSKTSIVVWRVDVHTADGALCAEGEVGASVFRATAPAPAQEPAAAIANGPVSRRRRRKRGGAAEAAAPSPQPAAAPPPPAPQSQQEPRAGGRRRRRRRSSSGGGGASSNENHAPAPAAAEPALPEPTVSPTTPTTTRTAANPLSRVMKRLRGTP